LKQQACDKLVITIAVVSSKFFSPVTSGQRVADHSVCPRCPFFKLQNAYQTHKINICLGFWFCFFKRNICLVVQVCKKWPRLLCKS